LQEAWVRQAQHREDLFQDLIREIWRDLRPTDDTCILTLGPLLRAEQNDGLLASLWPRAPELPPELDPENNSLSLPSNDAALALIRTGFDFRLFQFLFLLRQKLDHGENPLVRSSEHCQTAFVLAETGLELEINPSIKQIIYYILQHARSYLAAVEKIQSKVLSALRLLMQYADNPSYHRPEYLAVLREQESLVRHEFLTQLAAHQWLGLAERMHSYFAVLEDRDLRSQIIAGIARGMNWSSEQFKKVHDLRKKALQKAYPLFHRGLAEACLREIEPALPEDREPWVLLEDLSILDLWLRCQGSHQTAGPDELAKRATQLQHLSLQFVRQFGDTIRESDIQHLVLKLLTGVER
jgi:hypothetical protein